MSMPCCPPDSEKYLAPDYDTVGTITTLPDGTDMYCSGSGSNGIIVVPDIFGWNSGRYVLTVERETLLISLLKLDTRLWCRSCWALASKEASTEMVLASRC
jgi:hypothetical protein